MSGNLTNQDEADFLAKVNQDAALRGKLRAATDADGVVAVAIEAGFGQLEASIRSEVAKREAKHAQLSGAELEQFISAQGCCTQTSIYSGVR